MKMIYCTCNVSVVEQLTEMIEKYNILEYQIIEKVTAKNPKGESRLNNPIWPGYNSSVLMQVNEDEKASKFLQEIRRFNKEVINDNELITACSWSLDNYFYD